MGFLQRFFSREYEAGDGGSSVVTADSGGSVLKKQLLSQHPHYQTMCRKEEWPTMRAVLGELNERATKRAFLVRGKWEKDDNFETRVDLTQHLGVVEGLVDRLQGAVFRNDPEVKYGAEDGDEEGELAEWAENADGRGTSLQEILEDHAVEALGMGHVGFFVDKPRLPEGVEAPKNKGDEEKLGVRRPRIVVFRAEEIPDWGEDHEGALTWVKIQHVVAEQGGALSARQLYVEWILIDRLAVTVYRAPVKEGVRLTDQVGPNGLPMITRGKDIGEPVLHLPATAHGCGCVPFEILYGKKKGTLRSSSPLKASARADVAALNEDSGTTYSRYRHNVPLLFIKTDDEIANVIRDDSNAIKLQASEHEEVGYASTDSSGFQTGMDAVKQRKIEGHRQAGTDMTGLFEGLGGDQESGRAKQVRFGTTEARILSRFAKRLQDCHEGLLEIAARRMAPTIPGITDRQFEGSVRYSRRFEVADAEEIGTAYLAMASRLSEVDAWHEIMLRRYALASAGEISREDAEAISDQVAEMVENKIHRQEPVVMGPRAPLLDEDLPDGVPDEALETVNA